MGALVLKDGSIFHGKGIGVDGVICGELVFNTSQTGYQEILTDPSYTRQLLVFTQPHIGNVGANADDMESDEVHVKGAVMRSFSPSFSNWRGQESLKSFLERHQILALSGIDTRSLTQHLRRKGSQLACMMSGKVDYEQALHTLNQTQEIEGSDLAKQVSTKEIYQLMPKGQAKFHIVVVDFGVKRSILNSLLERHCQLTIVPAETSAETILKLRPDGVVLSNGPGDPAACTYAISMIRTLLAQDLPIMAICLGHQLLALACGAKTKKMTFGHHGANHPIQSLKTKQVAISSQNHGFVVDEESLPSILKVTHRSLFDGTIAGFELPNHRAFGFQGHPEAGPGPAELTSLFDHFTSLIEAPYAKTL